MQPQICLKSAWKIAKYIFHDFGFALTISSRQECHLKEIKLHMTRINSPPPPRVLLRAYLLITSVSTFFSHWTREMLMGGAASAPRLQESWPWIPVYSIQHPPNGRKRFVLNSQQPQWCGIGLEENSPAQLGFQHLSAWKSHCAIAWSQAFSGIIQILCL